MTLKQPSRPGTIAAIILVSFAMLMTTFVAMAASTHGETRTSATGVTWSPAGELGIPAATCGQASVVLNSASSYAVLSGTTLTNTGPSALTGNIGVGPGSAVTGFPPGTYTGTKDVSDLGAESDLTTAYNDAAGRSNCAISVAGNIAGETLTPGLYKSTSTLMISSGHVTLSGTGVFVFQVASGLTVTSGAGVVLSGGAQAANIFWQVGSSATLGTTTSMAGTILAYASITMDTGSHLQGRALARTGDVTLLNDTIVVPGSQGGAANPTGGSALPMADWIIIGVVAVAGVAALAGAIVLKGRVKPAK
jgi:ice-binding like protein